MRNLKRALSLALASVMLLGMMVVGSSAAGFADADEIVNKEAVEITAGLGLFAGSDGKFNPKGNVTRAQMATVIVKMLYGSEINADQFKGVGKFTDTASFEGGWAEGYINLCADRGIVKGYGDNTFKPGNQVTTAEAVTMIINALGVDAGQGDWPLTVMSKAEEMKLFAELAVKPGTNVALTRDELASVVLEGIQYSPAGLNGYKVPGNDKIIFTDLGDAVIANGNSAAGIKEVTGEDTLANKVFELKQKSGYVYNNQAIDKDAEYTQIGGEYFNIETGADLIGHYVTVYYQDVYKSEREPGKTYCIVDESTIINVEKDIVNDRVAFRAAFGARNLDQDTASVAVPNSNPVTYTTVDDVLIYDGTMNIATYDHDNDPTTPEIVATNVNNVGNYSYITYNASAGKYVVYDNEIVAYVAPTATFATKVTKISTTAGKETISIPNKVLQNNASDDEVNEYEGIAKDDIITYTITGDFYNLAKAVTVEAQVTGISQNTDNGRWGVTANGTRYEFFCGVDASGQATNVSAGTMAAEGISLLTGYPTGFNFGKTYTLYTTEAGKLIGYSSAGGASVDVSGMVYVNHVYNVEAANAYGIYTRSVYAQGVDMNGKEVNILIDVRPEVSAGQYQSVMHADAKAMTLVNNVAAGNFYEFSKVNNTEGAREGIMSGSIAPATFSNVALDSDNNGINESAPVYTLAGGKFATLTSDASKDRLDATSKYVLTAAGQNAYITADTKFILVTGTGSQIKTGFYTGSINFNQGTANSIKLLLTDDASGNKLAQAVVFQVNAVAVDSDPIYVSANQTLVKNATAAGYEFEVYNAKTGELVTLVLASANPLSVGFQDYTYDEEDKQHTITGAADASIIKVGHTFDGYYAGMLSTKVGAVAGLANIDAASAKVIDIRTEDQKKLTTGGVEIEEITTIDDIVYLKNEEQATITLDIIHDVKGETVLLST